MPLNKKVMKGSDRMNGSLKTNEESVDEPLLLQIKVILVRKDEARSQQRIADDRVGIGPFSLFQAVHNCSRILQRNDDLANYITG